MEIFDGYGVKLTEEELEQFLEDLWDIGIPPSSQELLIDLWNKWGHRFDIPKPGEK